MLTGSQLTGWLTERTRNQPYVSFIHHAAALDSVEVCAVRALLAVWLLSCSEIITYLLIWTTGV